MVLLRITNSREVEINGGHENASVPESEPHVIVKREDEQYGHNEEQGRERHGPYQLMLV